jgi:hypothetical protein
MALSLVALICFTMAQNASINDRQPIVSAPHSNPWKILLEEEAASVNTFLQDKMSLIGDLGSSKDSYM